MALLAPAPDFKRYPQQTLPRCEGFFKEVAKFARDNIDRLLSLKDKNQFSKEEIFELEAFLKFYENMENVANIVLSGEKSANVLEFCANIPKMIGETKQKQEDMGIHFPILCVLYSDFCLQEGQLRKILDLMLPIALEQKSCTESASESEVGKHGSYENIEEGVDAASSMLNEEMISEDKTREESNRNAERVTIPGQNVMFEPAATTRVTNQNGNAAYPEHQYLESGCNSAFSPRRPTEFAHQSKTRNQSEYDNTDCMQHYSVLNTNSYPEHQESGCNSAFSPTPFGFTNQNEMRNQPEYDNTDRVQHSSVLNTNSYPEHLQTTGNASSSGANSGDYKLKKLTPGEREKLRQKLHHMNQSNTYVTVADIKNLMEGKNAKETSRAERNGSRQREATGIKPNDKAIVKTSPSYGGRLRPRFQLLTLEESLNEFGFLGHLKRLEESLKDVRRGIKTPQEHEALCKNVDKALQKLSFNYHPDKVRGTISNNAEGEAKEEMQVALNATRIALRTLSRMFLEDIDIENTYEFYTKLEIGQLGNEDEVENHVYDVLFKISRISEIRQESIVAEIHKFLRAAQDCIQSYIQGGMVYKCYEQCNSAFSHLKRCVRGYSKLIKEFAEVVEESRSENLHNVYPLLRKMMADCQKEQNHLKALVEILERPTKHFTIYKGYHTNITESHKYYVMPLVSYFNVLICCRLMISNAVEGNTTWSLSNFKNWLVGNDSYYDENVSCDEESLLYYLASFHNGNSQYKRVLKNVFRVKYIEEINVPREFAIILGDVSKVLKSKYKIGDYNEMTTMKFITKELKLCMEMKAEFEEKKKEIFQGIEQMKNNSKYMNQRLDQFLQDHKKVEAELNTYTANNEEFMKRIKELIPQEKDIAKRNVSLPDSNEAGVKDHNPVDQVTKDILENILKKKNNF